MSDEEDLLYSDAVQLICAYGSYSSQLLQRRLHIGYWQASTKEGPMRADEFAKVERFDVHIDHDGVDECTPCIAASDYDAQNAALREAEEKVEKLVGCLKRFFEDHDDKCVCKWCIAARQLLGKTGGA